MESSLTLSRSPAPAAAAARTPRPRIADDKAMLRAAAELTRDLIAPRPGIYWADLIASAVIGYGALAVAVTVQGTGWVVLAAVVSALALYRALSFIHEVSHMKHSALPRFRGGWNALVGVPMLTPSFMYEGVHNLHHAKTRYGTSEDPEYLPLALMKPWTLPLFIVTALLLPIALLVRSALLVPLGAVIPSIRKLLWERASSLSINPQFRRRPPEGKFARMVFWQEFGVVVWSWFLIGWSATHGWRPLMIGLSVISITAVLNQIRTLVAHLWANEGDAITVTAQYLDSVNVPPPGILAELWAPVGLRYHALHHLLPSVPYHSYAEAHRRLIAHLGKHSTYDGANYPGLLVLVQKLVGSTMKLR